MGHNPLLTKFTCVNPRFYLSICHSLTQGRLAQAPKLTCIGKRHESVKRRLHVDAVFPKLIAGKVEIVVPNDAIATDINLHFLKEVLIFQSGKLGKSRDELLYVIFLCRSICKTHT